MSRVTLKHIYKVYEGGVRAVNDFELEIEDKEFIVFVGPSGCGKSTTLRMIAGLENITAGQLFIDDTLVNDVDSKDRDIAMVFQSYALYPHMTVAQNMAFGLKLRKLPVNEITTRVQEAAEILEIEELLSRKPKALSGGQRQRVALGRAIVREPKVFLLDEPLSNLDAKLRVQMRTEINKLHKRLATTFIYVTHDQTEAMTMGDRIVVMNKGFIQQVDSPINLYENPTNLFVATFLGSPQMNIIKSTLLFRNGQMIARLFDDSEEEVIFPDIKSFQLSKEQYEGKEVLFGVRPEHITVSEKGLKATINVVEKLGNETILYCRIKDNKQDVVIKGNNSLLYESGNEIFLSFDMSQAHLFDIESSQALLGVPRENRLDIEIKDKQIIFAKKVIKTSDNFKSRILWDTLEDKKLFLAFSPKSVHFQEKENDIAFEVKVAFVEKKTDSNTVFTKMKGYDKYIVFSLPKKDPVEVNDEMIIYVNEEKLYISDEHCNRLISHEIVYPNLVSGEVKVNKGLTYFHFGNNKILAPELEGLNGKQDIIISENLVSPIFSKKYYRKNKLAVPEMDKTRAVQVSAYDEDLLGSYNAAFVALSGMDTYATFFLNSDYSVYKCPKFHLELLPGALKKAN
jgi:multiple sugar transport system ATP-binding protein